MKRWGKGSGSLDWVEKEKYNVERLLVNMVAPCEITDLWWHVKVAPLLGGSPSVAVKV